MIGSFSANTIFWNITVLWDATPCRLVEIHQRTASLFGMEDNANKSTTKI
jgi:hypothetical protein